MTKPTYVPGCQARRCYSHKTGEVNRATQWVHIFGRTQHVCGSCGTAMAKEAGLVPLPPSWRGNRTVLPLQRQLRF